MNNVKLKMQISSDIRKVFPEIDIDQKISFDKYSVKNQIRVYKIFFTYIFEYLGIRESEYVFFKSKKYSDILYKISEILIISESIKESKGKDSAFLKDRERFWASQFGSDIFKKFCAEHSLT